MNGTQPFIKADPRSAAIGRILLHTSYIGSRAAIGCPSTGRGPSANQRASLPAAGARRKSGRAINEKLSQVLWVVGGASAVFSVRSHGTLWIFVLR